MAEKTSRGVVTSDNTPKRNGLNRYVNGATLDETLSDFSVNQNEDPERYGLYGDTHRSERANLER